MDDDVPIPPLTDYSIQVLELCRLLWGRIEMPANIQLNNPEYFEEQKRRQMLSNWLRRAIWSQPQQQQVDDKSMLVRSLVSFVLAMDYAKL